MAIGDLVKVLIVHIQFFCIVTRLNINWPTSVSGFTGLLSALTGAVTEVRGSAQCARLAQSLFWRAASNAQPALLANASCNMSSLRLSHPANSRLLAYRAGVLSQLPAGRERHTG